MKKVLLAVLLVIGILAAGVVLFLAGDHDGEGDPSSSPRPALREVPATASPVSANIRTSGPVE